MSYTILLVNPDGTQKELINARDVWYETALNQPGKAQFALPIHNTGLDLYDITLCYSKLYIYRDDVLRWAGEIQSRRADSQNGQLVYSAVGWMQLLAKRLVGTKDTPVDYNDTDASLIVSDAISDTQSAPYGDLDLTAGTLASASHHDRTNLQYESVLDLIQGLTNDHIQDGIDLEITPDKKFNTYYPAKGITRPEVVFATGENIISWSFSENGTDMANEVTALGSGQGTSMPTATETAESYLQTSYGLRQAAYPYKSVSDTSTLTGHAQSDLKRYQYTTAVVTITVDGSLYPTQDSYEVGDTVKVQIDEGGVQFDGLQRIYVKRVSIGNDGEEEVDLTFNPN